MFQKYRIIKSVDSEGRKVITYIKNTLGFDDNGKNPPKSARREKSKLPEALEMTVKLP